MNADPGGFGVLYVMRKGGHFFGLFQTDHVHMVSSQQLGRNGGVHCHIAASYDHGPARKPGCAAHAYIAQELYTVEHARELFSRDAGAAAYPIARRGEKRLKSQLRQIVKTHVAALAHACDALEFNAKRPQLRHLCVHHGIRQAVGRNAVTQHAARFGQGFKDLHLIAFSSQKPCAGEPGRTRSGNGNFLGVAYAWFCRRVIQGAITEILFNGIDVHRAVHFGTAALAFALMGAYAPRDGGKGIAFAQFRRCFVNLAHLHQIIIGAHIRTCRTFGHTGRQHGLLRIQAEHIKAAGFKTGAATSAF